MNTEKSDLNVENNGKLCVQHAREIYNIAEWSNGYFAINEQGNLCAQPHANQHHAIELNNLVDELKKQGLCLPILVRFTDILQSRVRQLTDAFAQSIAYKNYQGKYTAVYPIKVNQQFSVVQELLSHPDKSVGLEAGSKPELLAILGVATHPIKIICNGYKDSEFIRLATIGSQMGHDVCIVLEKLTELDTFLANLDHSKPCPSLGIRIKLHSAAKGKWQNTGGEKGKFGFNASQLLKAIATLQQHNKLHLLTLVHFHIGSQVANIRDIHNAMRECARHYAQLRQLNVNITTVDVGGGLGVDYEGSRSRSACSMNYSIDEYAKNVVFALADACDELSLPHPNIISESGRALTAHHAVLITNVIEKESAPASTTPEQPADDAPLVLQELWQSFTNITSRRVVEAYHDAQHYFADAHQQYINGLLDLKQWSNVEQLYFSLMRKVKQHLDVNSRSHRNIADSLNETLADKLFCNFSLFQSIPDVWGIEQLFPILPLSQMNTPLTQRSTIQDITCDSDGQVREYVDGDGIENSLPLPEFNTETPYLLGIFMVGAYQEILGDLHNLFGDTDSVQIKQLADGSHEFTQLIKGESAREVLRTVHFDSDKLLANYKTLLANNNLLTEQEQQTAMDELTQGIDGYTYFED